MDGWMGRGREGGRAGGRVGRRKRKREGRVEGGGWRERGRERERERARARERESERERTRERESERVSVRQRERECSVPVSFLTRIRVGAMPYTSTLFYFCPTSTPYFPPALHPRPTSPCPTPHPTPRCTVDAPKLRICATMLSGAARCLTRMEVSGGGGVCVHVCVLRLEQRVA